MKRLSPLAVDLLAAVDILKIQMHTSKICDFQGQIYLQGWVQLMPIWSAGQIG